MQTTDQAPPAPATPGTPVAPVAPRAITITGADGKTTTISLSGNAPALAGTEVAPPALPTEDTFAEGAAVGVTTTLLILGVFALYNRFKHRGVKQERAQLSADSTARFDRLERGIDAIAIEVERISEGQRFVTKMMAESRMPAALSEKLPG
ncbi:MAG: hypothetical protein ABIZ36_07815 [Gemmatimonadaceae bacterium]